jgi:atypical dual specificity phosphatase
MPAPDGFSWIDRPHLAGMAQPASPDALHWLREHGIQLLITLSEEPLRRDWVNDAGLFAMHVPVVDLTAPTQKQLDLCVAAIDKAVGQNLGVGVHCGAGLGRTGTILAAYLVAKNMSAREALQKIRRLRPGSVETPEQEEALVEFARRRHV